MATNYEQVRSIFMAALERPADEWNAYLAEACGTDVTLREHVEILLEAHRSRGGILDNVSRAGRETVPPPAQEMPGLILDGKYKLIERIGEGGMGSVWLAQQSEPVKRKVAVKLIKLGMDSRQVLTRFEAERQALATMDHPNIAKVLDGGLTTDGRPFFVMELVKGTPITEYCDACKSSLKDRLELFVPVCQAIQHAHQKGIIHRDIKPSNVMIALYDDRPVPKVIDFGVAKATGQSLSAETLNTGFGGVIGTPQYMSPEQATLNNLDIDTRSDIYSLGVLLYELLTGSPPFTKEELEKKGLIEMLRVVREDEPPKPSTKLSTAAALPSLSANRSIEPRKLTQMLQSELDWIVLKALEKNRTRRYETANGLAADVNRYLSGEPVLAHPPSSSYLMMKFLRRHRPQVLAASLLAVALLAGIAGTTYGLVRAKTQAIIAQENASRAEQSRQEADQARILADAARALAETDNYNATLGEAKALWGGRESGWREKALGDLKRLAVMPALRRDLSELRTEAAAELAIPDIALVSKIDTSSGGDWHYSFAFSPDGRSLLIADPNAGLDAWGTVVNGHLFSTTGLAVGEGGPTNQDLVVSLPDGQGLAVGTRDSGIVFTNARGARTPRAPITHKSSRPLRVAISANGQRIAVGWSDEGGVTIHDASTGVLLDTCKYYAPVWSLSADGKYLACEEGSDIVLLPIASDQPRVVLGPNEGSSVLTFSLDGRMLAAVSGDHVTLFDVAKREKSKVLQGHRADVTDAAFSPDGEWVATGSYDYTTRIWETRTGQNVVTLPTFGSPAFGVKWSPTGEYLAASENNARQIFLYKMTGRNGVCQWLTGATRELGLLAVHPYLEEIVTCGYSELNRWDLSAARVSPVTFPPEPGTGQAMVYSSDGALLATASWGSETSSDACQILIRDGNTGEERSRITGIGFPYAVAFDPKGGQLAFGDVNGEITLFDLATNHAVRKFSGSASRSIIFLNNLRRLLTHSHEALLLFNIESGELERTVDLAGGIIRRIVADRQQSRLVVAFENGAIGSVSLPDMVRGPRREKAHDAGVRCVALSPDGRLLATAGDDCLVKLLDATSFETLLEFPSWPGTPLELTFDCAGNHLAVVGHPREVELWDITALRDGLTKLGLGWEQPASAEPSSTEATPGP